MPKYDGTGFDEPDPHIPPPPSSDAARLPPPTPPPPSTLPKDPPPPSTADVNPGQDNHVSPAAGTPFTGELPGWVLEITKTDQIDTTTIKYPQGSKDPTPRKIKLYWFRFLGVGFMDGGVGNGVNRGLLKRLLSAQEDLYRQYREQMGAPADDGDDQKKFKAFCQAKQVIGGQGPRGGGNHRDGSACDIEYDASPWVPIKKGEGSTGEVHNRQENRPEAEAVEWSRINVWEPCLTVCDRASYFCLGSKANARMTADASRSYDGFKELHDSLVTYLSYRYPRGASGDLTEVNEADFLARVKAEKDTALKSSKVYRKNSDGSKLEASDLSAASDDDLKAAFAQIAEDRKTMRYGMVRGKLSVVNDKIDESAANYREPCRGFLMLKKEVVLALLKTGLRWGGQEFGDMMHFDMGYEILNEFFELFVSARAKTILATAGASDDDTGSQKVKEAATIIKTAVEAAGLAANKASLAGNTAKEDACWASVAAANSVLNKVDAAKTDSKKAAGPKATDEKKQKALDAADAALAAAKKVADDANTTSAL